MQKTLVLGTAQFGLNYGVANNNGQTGEEEAEKILSLAEDAGVRFLDTAIAYGESEKVLGKLNRDRFGIITKLPKVPDDCKDLKNWATDHINSSTERLQVPKLKALLLHEPLLLAREGGRDIYDVIQGFIEKGKIEKFGVSIYSYNDLEQIPEFVNYDIVQSPFSVFDQSLKKSGWLDKLNRKGVTVQVRSIFLQGLLLMDPLKRPKYFDPWKDHLERWDHWVSATGKSPMEACIASVQSVPGISQIVFGVDSAKQFSELFPFFHHDSALGVPDELASDDEKLIYPFHSKLN